MPVRREAAGPAINAQARQYLLVHVELENKQVRSETGAVYMLVGYQIPQLRVNPWKPLRKRISRSKRCMKRKEN